MDIDQLLNETYWGNTVREYLIALAIAVVGIIVLAAINVIVIRRLKAFFGKTRNTVDDYIIGIIQKSILPLLFIGCVYAGIRTLDIEASYLRFIENVWMVIFTFFSIRIIASFIEFLLKGYVRRRFAGSERKKEVRGMLVVLKFVLWILGFVFLLDNLGYNVTTVITGLGIGGIAVALAAQTILGDLFSYFVIFFDRPFEIGDFIIAAPDKMGTVESVGIKTTRVRSLGGEEIIFSNKDLTEARLHNYKRMGRRRVLFKFGVTYDTPSAVLEEIPEIVRKAIEDNTDTTFDRAHFFSFGDSSLDFEVVYYVESADYNIYMDKQQAINLSLVKEFEKRNIQFAFPTRTVYLQQQGEIGPTIA